MMRCLLARNLELSLALVALCALGCGASAPPPSPGLPNREVLGPGPSPMSPLEGGEASLGGSVRHRPGTWNGAIDELAFQLARALRWNGRDRMKVAVLDFVEAHGRECSLGAPAAEDLTTSLFATNKFEIIERRMLDSVLKENAATQTDLYDPGHVARLGGLMGADAFVTGTVVASEHEYAFNTRVILAESGGVASAARVTIPLSESDGRGTCGDGRQIIAAPPL